MVFSGLYQLRSSLHYEIAKIAIDHRSFQVGAKHLEKVEFVNLIVHKN